MSGIAKPANLQGLLLKPLRPGSGAPATSRTGGPGVRPDFGRGLDRPDARSGLYVEGAFRQPTSRPGPSRPHRFDLRDLKSESDVFDLAAGLEGLVTTHARSEAILGGTASAAMEHTCLADWKFDWLVRRGLVDPGNGLVRHLLRMLLGRDVLNRRGRRVRTRRVAEQLRMLRALQRAFFGVGCRIYMNLPEPPPDVDGSVDLFFSSPRGLQYPTDCPCCEIRKMIREGHTITLGAVSVHNPNDNQPFEIIEIRCPPCDPCDVALRNYVGIKIRMSLSTSGPAAGAISESIGGVEDLIYRTAGVIDEPPPNW